MIADLVIKNGEKSNLKDILALHKEAFGNFDEHETLYKDIKKTFKKGHITIALIDQELAGFNLFYCMRYHTKKDEIEEDLYHAQNPDEDYFLKCILSLNAKRLGLKEVIIDHFDNEFTKKGIRINDDDIYFGEMVVNPTFRRKGIAQKLLERDILFAKEKKASAIYADCLEGSGTEYICSKLGFLPIIRMGPSYSNGTSGLFMGLKL